MVTIGERQIWIRMRAFFRVLAPGLIGVAELGNTTQSFDLVPQHNDNMRRHKLCSVAFLCMAVRHLDRNMID